VEGLAGYVLDSALDPLLAGKSLARRAGVIRTRAISRRMMALLLRLRYHIVTTTKSAEHALLAEDWQLVAFAGPPSAPEWQLDADAERLLDAQAEANIPPDVARTHLERVLAEMPALESKFGEIAKARGDSILEAHRRVRRAVRTTGVTQCIKHKPPVDVLGVYVYLPADGGR
jgi:hypothetical protein